MRAFNSTSRRFIRACFFLSTAVVVFTIGTPKASAQALQHLQYRIIDAEYSNALERIVSVSATPQNQLHIYNPMTGTEVAVDLPLPPSSVSVSPNGLYAAVGHNAWVSYVNLTTPALEKSLPVAIDVLDVVLAGNGFVYAFPRRDQWENIHCIQISTGVVTIQTGGSIYAGTLGKLHPNGRFMYATDNNLSPSDLEKFSIENGTAALLYDSPYHGDYAVCGDLWFSEDGFRIFTRCGNVFRASEVRTEDMTYAGSLSNQTSGVQSVDHSSSVRKIVAIPRSFSVSDISDTKINYYDDAFMLFQQAVSLPTVTVGTQAHKTRGKFVFFNRAGTQVFVVTQIDAAAGFLFDYAVATYGQLPGPASPTIRISLTGCVTCRAGDELIVTATVRNPSNADIRVEVKGGVEQPNGSEANIWSIADKHYEISLPPGFETTVEFLRITIPPDLRIGTWVYEAALLSPDLGRTLSRSSRNFSIQ